MKFLLFLRHITVAVVFGCAATWLVWPLVEPQPRSVFTFPGVVRKFCQFHPNGKWLIIETFSRKERGSFDECERAWRYVNVETGHQDGFYRLEDEAGSSPFAALASNGRLTFIEERIWDHDDRQEFLTVVTALNEESLAAERLVQISNGGYSVYSDHRLSPDGKWLVVPPREPTPEPTDNAFAMTGHPPEAARYIPDEDEPITPVLPLGADLCLIDRSHGWFPDARFTFEYGAWLDRQWNDPQIAFSPDGDLMAVTIPCQKVWSLRDDLIQVWDLNEKKLLHTLTGSDGIVQAVWFDVDGQTLCAEVVPNGVLNEDEPLDYGPWVPRQFEVRYDWKSGDRKSATKIKHTTLDRADGWQLIQRFPETFSFTDPPSPIEVLAPGGRRSCALPGEYTDMPTVCRFVPGTNLIERSSYQLPKQPLLRTIGIRFPWLSPLFVHFLHDEDRDKHPGKLQIVDRRNGASVWHSSWSYNEQMGDRSAGQGLWLIDPHPHAVSRDGKLLAEGTCDGYSTTFRFWDLSQRHWPARFANGLGLLVAAAYCYFRRRRHSQTSVPSESSSPVGPVPPVFPGRAIH